MLQFNVVCNVVYNSAAAHRIGEYYIIFYLNWRQWLKYTEEMYVDMCITLKTRRNIIDKYNIS